MARGLVAGGSGYSLALPHWERLCTTRVRRVRGRLEDAATKEITHKAGFEDLPKFADQMLLDWMT